MKINLYNTLTRKMEVVRASDGSTFRFYCCGPTVYGPAHIGNLRTFVLQDLFRRVIEFSGIQTSHVRNITDVDDKTIRESQNAGIPLEKFTSKWSSKFADDCDRLEVLRPSHEPSAVAHIPDQVRLIETLIEKGHAYQVENQGVYFRIHSFPTYGKLSGLKMEGNRQNASDRLTDSDEYGKESWQDFALWKAWKPDDGPNRWDSPWGPGRPGWHIECSAMSMRYLGESFDLHSGGVDLIFPHHENEIAQSEAATGQPFARHWFHVAHLRVEGEKMSKSLGNLHTLDDVVRRGFSPAALRYLLLSSHYRQPLNFTWESLAAAESTLNRIHRHTEGLDSPPSERGQYQAMETAIFNPVIDALCEDLNTPKALGALNVALRKLNQSEESQHGPIRRDLARVLQLFGLPVHSESESHQDEIPVEIDTLARRREQARQARAWQEADALRDALHARGWQVRDTAEGFELKPTGGNG